MDFQNPVLFVFTIGILFILWHFTMKIYKHLFSDRAEILTKLENLETLLVDIRDGTKSFYKEKRTSPRVREHITAKIAGSDGSEFMQVVNLSYNGAMIKTTRNFERDQIIDLNLFLPLYPQPVNVRARIVKVAGEAITKKASQVFNISIEFLSLAAPDKEKITETVDVLKRSNP